MLHVPGETADHPKLQSLPAAWHKPAAIRLDRGRSEAFGCLMVGCAEARRRRDDGWEKLRAGFAKGL